MDGEIIIANLKCHSFVKSLPEKFLRPLLSPQLLHRQCLVGYVDFVQDTIVIVNHNDFFNTFKTGGEDGWWQGPEDAGDYCYKFVQSSGPKDTWTNAEYK